MTWVKALGFTLIEVLIAMALLSIMMLLLFSSMRVSVRNWDAGEARIAKVSNAVAAHTFFRRHLAIVKPLFDDFSDEDETLLAFQGDVNTVKFVSPLPTSAPRLGLQLFTVTLEKDDHDVQGIYVALEPFFPTTEGRQWRGDKVLLIDQVATLEFSYFGVADADNDAFWHDQWVEQLKIPELIKINISLEGGVVWPEIVVATRIVQAVQR